MGTDFPTLIAYLTIICVLIIGVPGTISNSSCSGSGATSLNGTCYRYYAAAVTWFKAKQLCEEHDLVLASVTSLDHIKSIFVNQNLGDEVWIGTNDIAIEGRYIWIQDNHLANEDLKELWLTNEPNNAIKQNGADEDCVTVTKDFKLSDDTCRVAHSYICMDRTKFHGLHSLLKNCPDGKFGYKCRYTCHCPRNQVCDKVTGLCNDGLCEVGYWGPGCQLVDTCYYNNQSKKYLGMLTLTERNWTCQLWSSDYPHEHKFTAKDFLDRKLPKNFCRRTFDSFKPWCYTTRGDVRWDHCSLKSCGTTRKDTKCPRGSYDIYCSKDCHCKDVNEQCNEVTGECHSGCAVGWSRKDCQTVIPCERNLFGWDCDKTCQCNNPIHCDRFVGEASICSMNVPVIVHLGNNQVFPGQAATFNCTVNARSPPRDDEIQLFGPQGKNITYIPLRMLESSASTRTHHFYVSNVQESEQYTCFVLTSFGHDSLTHVADLFPLPECPKEVVVSTVDDFFSISWKAMQNTEYNLSFRVIMYNTTNNLKYADDSEGVVVRVVLNSSTETTRFLFNVSGLLNWNQSTITMFTFNDYGEVECSNITKAIGATAGQNETHIEMGILVSIVEAVLLFISWIIIALVCAKQRRYKENAPMHQNVELKEKKEHDDGYLTPTDRAHDNICDQNGRGYDSLEMYHDYETIDSVKP